MSDHDHRDVPEAGPAEADVRVRAGAMLLDVREQDEWDAGHAPGADHVPMSEVPGDIGRLSVAPEILVICRSGARSRKVVGWLRTQGVNSVNVAGGMQSWAQAGLPVIRDDGEAGGVI